MPQAKLKGILARRCVANAAPRQLIVNGQPLKAPRLYQHPAHAHFLINIGRSQGWKCGICNFLQVDGGEQRQRYHCDHECDYDVCADCMTSEYSAWHTHREKFIQGESIVFSGLKYMGWLQVNSQWPDPSDHQRYLEMVDQARRAGDLPWRAKEHRSLHLFSSHIAISSDTENNVGWEQFVEPRVYHRLPATEIASLTLLNDHPSFMVAIVGPAIGCHILECQSMEVADGICITVQRAFDHVFQAAVLDTVEDSIDAVEEGRAPKYAPPQHRFSDTLAAATFEEESAESKSRDASVRSRAADGANRNSGVTEEQQAALIADYLAKLQQIFGQTEVMRFAKFLREYRLNRDFAVFTQGLLDLFKEKSSELLPGLRPFLPTEDRGLFEEFLRFVAAKDGAASAE